MKKHNFFKKHIKIISKINLKPILFISPVFFIILYSFNFRAIAINSSEKPENKEKIVHINPIEEIANKVSIKDIDNTYLLQLVNSEHFVEKVMPVVNLSNISASRENIEINPIVLEQCKKMFEDASNQGYDNIMITSGFRTKQYQERLYNNSSDKSFVQKPGFSEHETGLAIDIMPTNGPMESLGDTDAGKWLAENCYKYGFILRYPEDKEEITKISPESWHFRYVGKPHAMLMKQYNFCFEEYIDYLKQNIGYQISENNTLYTVSYLYPENGYLYIPKDGKFTISSDNCGGYILTLEQ